MFLNCLLNTLPNRLIIYLRFYCSVSPFVACKLLCPYNLRLVIRKRKTDWEMWFFLQINLTLFYMGFWWYVNTWGGQIDPLPLIKSRKNDWNLVKRHVFAKIDYCCHYLCIWSWIITIFHPKKDPKIDAFLHV